MTWKDFLNKCNEAYSLGEVYVTTFDDVECIKRDTGIVLEELSPVSDRIYDQVYYKCKELYPTDSLFQALTSVNTGYGVDIELPTPAGSLDECKLGELQKWIDPNQDYIISEKLDGCSIILFYINGRLTKCVTRGDGYKGKDVTRHVASLVPVLIDSNFSGMIRGELICPKSDIKSMIDDLKQETGREYKNGRNTIAGFLNSKETLKSVIKYARVVVYSIMDSNKPQSEQLKFLKLYFKYVAAYETFHGNEIDEPSMIDKVNWYHANGTYETDGIVVTLDQFGKVKYETNSINPTNARKFKVISSNGETEQRVQTKVLDITWQVSKDGKLKPVLQVEPVDIGGVTVSNVTGNNYTWIRERQCGIGSEVKIVRSNSVIPKIVNIVTPSTTFNEASNTHMEGVDLVLNDKNTFEVNVKKLVHFAQTLELDQAGEASMEKLLMSYPQLKNPVEMFGLTLGSFRTTLGLNGVKLFESLKKAHDNGITKSKLADACGCFGAGLGESLLAQIEQKYGDLKLLDEDIENFGPARMNQYNDKWLDWQETELIYAETHGGKFKEIKKSVMGKIVTPTGFRFTAEEKAKLELLGWGSNDSLNKNTTVLVVKDLSKTSSKTEKAAKLGIPVKSYDDLKKELNI
jgi:DNA ligase (NAD+)